MYRIKQKKDADKNKYYIIQKKIWFFWIKVFEYGNYDIAKERCLELNSK